MNEAELQAQLAGLRERHAGVIFLSAGADLVEIAGPPGGSAGMRTPRSWTRLIGPSPLRRSWMPCGGLKA